MKRLVTENLSYLCFFALEHLLAHNLRICTRSSVRRLPSCNKECVRNDTELLMLSDTFLTKLNAKNKWHETGRSDHFVSNIFVIFWKTKRVGEIVRHYDDLKFEEN